MNVLLIILAIALGIDALVLLVALFVGKQF